MFIKIAWKNIWRNRMRSLVVICSVALGLWAGIFVTGFYKGIIVQKIDDVISLEISHFQFHSHGFRDDFMPENVITGAENILNELETDLNVSGFSARVVAMGMMASPTKSGAVRVSGVNPDDESALTTVDDHIVEGSFLGNEFRHPVVVSRKLAGKYQLKIKSKIVITVQDVHGEITSGAFRVTGIFETSNGMFDEMNIFVSAGELSDLTGVGDGVHEIAVLLKEHDLALSHTALYQEKYPDSEVLSWMDLSTGMRFMVEAMDTYMIVIVGIILLALLFGIVNTMLMSILERTREIGVLMSIGMSKLRIFLMIVGETVMLAVSGGPPGVLLAWATIAYFGAEGIDLGPFAETYMDLGFAPVIYPLFDTGDIILITAMVLIMSVIASVFPAYRGLKLKPVEALRKL